MLIELSEFNIKIFFPLIYPIFRRIQNIPEKAYALQGNRLFKTFRYFLSYTLGVIPFLIIKYRTKKANTIGTNKEIEFEERNDSYINPLSEDGEINKIIQKNIKKRKIRNILYIISLCALGIFSFYYIIFFHMKFEYSKQSVGIFFQIFEYIMLSYFILKQKLYKHHFVSSGIIAFTLMILFIITLFYIDSEDIFLTFVFYFFFSLCFGLYDILKKKYMINYFYTPYFVMFIVGIINVVLLLIFDLFIYFSDSGIEGIIYNFKNNVTSVSMFFIFIIDIILQWIYNTGIWLTIYYLTTCHFFISDYIAEFIYYIMNAIEKKDEFYSTVNVMIFSIVFCINFFCCLVFNEVIILNFWGLDYNTKKRIRERVGIDSIYIKDEDMIELDENIAISKEEEKEEVNCKTNN